MSFFSAIQNHDYCARNVLEPNCNSTVADFAEQLFRIARGDVTSDCDQYFSSCGAKGTHCTKVFLNLMRLSFIVLLIFISHY